MLGLLGWGCIFTSKCANPGGELGRRENGAPGGPGGGGFLSNVDSGACWGLGGVYLVKSFAAGDSVF